MTQGENWFLENGKAMNSSGSNSHLGLFVLNEKKLDQKLWHDPEHAGKDIQDFLASTSGTMSPLLSRLALKGISHPLFIREAQDSRYNEANDADIQNMALRNAVILNSYLDLMNDPDVNQSTLNQAIGESVVVQLTSRTFGTSDPDLDDVILLPTAAIPEHVNVPTQFTVLRRKSLGRARLIFTTMNKNQQQEFDNLDMIFIHPGALVGLKSTLQRLAEVLVAEQQLEQLSEKSMNLITDATSHLYTKIYEHFDTTKTQK